MDIVMYGGICLIGAGLSSLFVPETKGRSLEQIEMQCSLAQSPKNH